MLIYKYDNTNRLTGVKSLGEDQGSNSSYSYLADGRFEMKQEKDGAMTSQAQPFLRVKQPLIIQVIQ